MPAKPNLSLIFIWGLLSLLEYPLPDRGGLPLHRGMLHRLLQWLFHPPDAAPSATLLIRLMAGGVFLWEGVMKFDEVELESVPFEIATTTTEPAVDADAPRFKRFAALIIDLSLFAALALALSPLLPASRGTLAVQTMF